MSEKEQELKEERSSEEETQKVSEGVRLTHRVENGGEEAKQESLLEVDNQEPSGGARLLTQNVENGGEEAQQESLLEVDNQEPSGEARLLTQNVDNAERIFEPPDGGWGWVVCFASFWANGIVFGIINTFGILFVKMKDRYTRNDPEISLKTAFVGSICAGLLFFLSYLSSILSDRLGIRQVAFTGSLLATAGLFVSAFIERLELLYLTYGVMLGVGSSLVYSQSLSILGHYFRRHLGIANGFASFGSSAFTIALTIILPLMLSSVDIKYCFLLLSGLNAVLIFLSLSWKPLLFSDTHKAVEAASTSSDNGAPDGCCSWTKKYFNLNVCKNRAFVVWCFSFFVALFGYFVPFFHLPQHTKDNFPGKDGSWLILCLSITSAVSRIVFGKVADVECVSRIRMHQLAFFILGVTTACIPFATTFGGLIVISLFMGICDGVVVCLLGPIAYDIVGPTAVSQAIGFLLCVISIPHALGAPVAGLIYDKMGNYRLAFHLAGLPPILGATLMFLVPRINQGNVTDATANLDFAVELQPLNTRSPSEAVAGAQDDVSDAHLNQDMAREECTAQASEIIKDCLYANGDGLQIVADLEYKT